MRWECGSTCGGGGSEIFSKRQSETVRLDPCEEEMSG